MSLLRGLWHSSRMRGPLGGASSCISLGSPFAGISQSERMPSLPIACLAVCTWRIGVPSVRPACFSECSAWNRTYRIATAMRPVSLGAGLPDPRRFRMKRASLEAACHTRVALWCWNRSHFADGRQLPS